MRVNYKAVWGAVIVLLAVLAAPVQAQVIPTSYRITRTAPGEQANTFTFARADMQCALTRAPFEGPGLRINDPANDALDCQYSGPGNWSNLAAGVAYTFSLVGCVVNTSGQTVCGPSASVTTGVPGVPGGFRIAPGFTGVTISGLVNDIFRIGNTDVFRVNLTQFGPDVSLLVGSNAGLTAGDYTVTRGDQFQMLLQRRQ